MKPTAIDTAIEFASSLSHEQLFDQYRILEIRKRYWSRKFKLLPNSTHENKLANVQLWMQKLWEEMVKRVDEYDYRLFEYLIESCTGFSILGQ